MRLAPYTGLGTALLLLSAWVVSLVALLAIDPSQMPPLLIVPAILIRVFLQTGIFITAHDAIHGVVFPQNRTWNNRIGALALMLYALLPYKQVAEKHWQHHRYPASDRDPDFHNTEHQNPILWYWHFMRGYQDRRQIIVLIVGMTLIFHSLRLFLHVPATSLLLFWVLPIFLSSLQLFYFGIFLPHRRPAPGYNNSHRATSIHYTSFWSFLACYHFGYHLEHHEFPYLAWYQLPQAYRSGLAQQAVELALVAPEEKVLVGR